MYKFYQQINSSQIQYWQKYLLLDVLYKNKRKYYHYYNDIPYTRWPFYLSNAVFLFLLFGLFSINKLPYVLYFTAISFFLVLFYMYQWFKDMVIESLYLGKYNRKIRAVIVFGFLLFLSSESMLFAGFFWTYLDRCFHSTVVTGAASIPMGMELIIWYKKPMFATLVLYFSSIAFNCSSYCLKWGSWYYSTSYALFGLFLGYMFIVIQIKEYNHLNFNITDSVFSSCFYLLTGFHGMHVIIGVMFLNVQVERLISWQFTRERHLGYSLALVYWNFVDLIWFILFFLVYIFNTSVAYQFTAFS